MKRFKLSAACALAALGLAGTATAAQLPKNVLYVESNNTIDGQNSILAYRRNDDGSLTALPGSPFLTGGTGWFDSTYAVGPFDGDGILAVDRLTNILYVPNGHSDTVAGLLMNADGSLAPISGSPFVTAGNTPDALAIRNRNLIVLSNAQDPLQAGPKAVSSYSVGRLGASGAYLEQASKAVARPQTAVPSQLLEIPKSPFVLANEIGTDTVTTYRQDAHGALTLVERVTPPQEGVEKAQPVSIGLAINPVAPYVYEGLPNVGRVAIYRLSASGRLTYLRSVASSGIAPCWIRFSKNGLRMYVVNTVDDSISTYDMTDPAKPVQIQHLLLKNAGGFSSEFSLSPDERFLYSLEEEGTPKQAGKSNKVHALAVSRADGTLTELPSSPTQLPVPAGNRPQGVLVY
jgi:6-phosphogluconolactonase (cycloisomerase 2 family)